MMTEPFPDARASSGANMDRLRARPLRRWWNRRPAQIGLAALVIAIVLWRVLPASGSTDVARADIEIGEVTRGPFEDYLPVRATVAPRLSTFVGVLSGGQVERLLVQDGARVAAGEPLATLANPELRLDVLTREAQIASQLGQVAGEGLGIERSRLDRAGEVAQARYDLIKAERELAIRQQLHDQGFVSDAGVKSFQDEESYQKQRLAQLQDGQAKEASITATQSRRLEDARQHLSGNLRAVRAGLDALTIRAPADGRLTNFTLQPGQTLKPGDPAGQVDSEGSWKLEADVDEYYLGHVAVGQKGRTSDGLRLTVSKVLSTVKDGRFRVELTFDAPVPKGLNRGQALDVRITLGRTASAILAPVGGWLDSGGGRSAFVLDADGRHARRRAIRIGSRNPEQVEVLSGLKRGARIVTSNTASSTASIRGDILNID